MTLLVTVAASVLAAAAFVALFLLVPRLQKAVVSQVLRERVVEVTNDLAADPRLTDPLTQVLDENGEVVPGLGDGDPLLSAEQVDAVPTRGLAVDLDVPKLGGRLQVLAVPLGSALAGVPSEGERTLVVAVRLGPLDALTDRVSGVLGVAAGLVVVAAAAGAWFLTGAVLRPVAAMTDAAARIGSRPGARRLPRPGTADEVDRLAATFNALLERLDAGIRRERAFVDDASHELRTPLTVLRGELELASDESDPSQVRRGVVMALGAVERLSALTESLLVLARLDDGTSHRPTPTDLVACIRAAAFGVPGLDVTLNLGAGPGPDGPSHEGAGTSDSVRIMGDRVAIERALGNLLRNALNAGATRVRVTMTRGDDTQARQGSDALERDAVAVAAAELVLLDVEDDGPGFPAVFLPHAFERFARADGARGNGGSGLGLAIVAAVAENHGGDVAADNLSALGGARVRIRLVTVSPDG